MNDVEHSIATFATRLTPTAPAAIAVIELSGPSAEKILTRCWKPATERPRRIGAIRYGAWITPSRSHSELAALSAVQASEDVIVCWIDWNTVEIHCHGGKQAAERILSDLKNQGAELRSTDVRTSRQAVTPHVAAALIDLQKATTELTTAILLDQVRGALSLALDEIRACMDAGQNQDAISKIDELLSRKHYGLHLTQAWQLAIVGPPNAGKSSLLNAVLGYDRAIVDATAGTTRDALNEFTSLLGWPFALVDTAGIHETTDVIEREGVKRTYEVIESSDVILLLIEPRQGWTTWHEQIFDSHASKCIAVHTKIDLELPFPKTPSALVGKAISAQMRIGIDSLYEAILTKLVPIPPQLGQAVPFRIEHVDMLENWLRELTVRR